MPSVFGHDVTGKATGTRVPGAQGRMMAPGHARDMIATALTPVGRNQAMNTQPDPTMGAPFSSFPDNRLTVAQMGPGQPAENFPLGGEPRQYQYQVGRNFPTPPDAQRGISGDILRSLADASWLVRKCLEIRKGELTALDWDIVATGRTAAERKHNASRNAELIDHVREFLRYPEAYFTLDDFAYQEQHPNGVVDAQEWRRQPLVEWTDWLNACLEDVFVGDWLSLWPQRTLGNEMLGLRRVDGKHIKVIVDLDGRLPPPPMPAFQQYLYSVPRASWAANEFYFLPRNLRNMTTFGYSLIQQCLIAIDEALKFDQWNVAAYSSSTLPMGLLETPQMPADQIQDIADFLNGAIADISARQQIHPVPAGTKWQPIKPFNFDPNFALYIIETICACMEVPPQELGFAPARAGMGGSGHAEVQNTIGRRKTLLPTARWWERKMTQIINEQWRRQGGGFLQFRFTDLVHAEAAEKFAAYETALQSGQVTLDELLEEQGEPGPGIGRTIVTPQGTIFADKGFILTANGIVPLRLPDPGDPSIYGPHQPPQPGERVEHPGAGDAAPKAAKVDDWEPYGARIRANRSVPGVESTEVPAARVLDYLKENYPESVLGWVDGLEWHRIGNVPLDRIDMDRRPGGRNRFKVNSIASDLRDGKKMEPVVLVETPDGLQIADGYHRTLAYRHADRKTIPAYVGIGAPAHGPWEREMHAAKLNKAATADEAQEDADRRKREEEFIAAWLLWWKRRLRHAAATEPTDPEMAHRALELSYPDQDELAIILQDTLRGPVYADALALVREQAGVPERPATTPDLRRLETGSQTHMVAIIQTYATDLEDAFQRLLAATELDPDQAARATTILAALVEWAQARAQWKGEQIAITEATDAQSQASRDFATHNPRQLSMMRWRAVMDDRTCDICRGLDGQIVSVAGPHPPAHPNCRCVLIPVEPNTGAP